MDYGPDGYLVVITCAVPEHAARREVLATFKGAAIRKDSIAMISDHPPDPPTQDVVDNTRLRTLASLTTLTQPQMLEAIKLMAKRG